MSEPMVDMDHNSEQRIRRVVDRARREAGLRDLLTFCLARIWTVLLILGAVCSAWYASTGNHTRSPDAGCDPLG